MLVLSFSYSVDYAPILSKTNLNGLAMETKGTFFKSFWHDVIIGKFRKTLWVVCTNANPHLIADQRKFRAKYLQIARKKEQKSISISLYSLQNYVIFHLY